MVRAGMGPGGDARAVPGGSNAIAMTRTPQISFASPNVAPLSSAACLRCAAEMADGTAQIESLKSSYPIEEGFNTTMCGRYGRLSRFERIMALSKMSLRNDAGDFEPSYNVAPGTLQPVIRGDEYGPVLTRMKWGLVPYWAKDCQGGVRPVNAKSDTAQEKPMFRKLIRERRCLVPVDWFYEWRENPSDKVPHVIRMVSGEPFFMGGLWDTWHAGQPEALSTFTVLTTSPNRMMQSLHHRMPVIVAPEHAKRWLNGKDHDVNDLLLPYPAEEMTAYAVSTRVNSVRNDGPDLIAAVSPSSI